MGTRTHLTTAQGIYVQDPTKPITIQSISNNGFSGNSSKFANGGDLTPKWGMLIEKLELKVYTQSIRIIQLENKLDSEECENLKKMLMSNDEASVILAKEIIDNVEQ
jgi:hypothetical protein